MKNILITGGAGFIGSHVLRLISKNNDYNITVIDNLHTGFKEAVDIVSKEASANINFVKLDLRDSSQFEKIEDKKFDAVLHFAALLSVNESAEKPLMYFNNNVAGSINLLRFMKKVKCKNIVFSSTSSLYSRHAKVPFTEKSEIEPENPYAESKYMMEKIISWTSQAYEMNYFILRYFNPCGCSLDAKIGYPNIPAIHLFPAAIRGALGLQNFKITCGKVDTPDGSTIRDYFNILDLADIHNIALKALLEGHKGGIYNVGIGKGHSVFEIVKLVERVTNYKFKIEYGNKREGELPIVYCDPQKFKNEFNWKPKYTLEQAVESLVKWFKKRPQGYKY